MSTPEDQLPSGHHTPRRQLPSVIDYRAMEWRLIQGVDVSDYEEEGEWLYETQDARKVIAGAAYNDGGPKAFVYDRVRSLFKDCVACDGTFASAADRALELREAYYQQLDKTA